MSCVYNCPVTCNIVKQLKKLHLGWIHASDFHYDEVQKLVWLNPDAVVRNNQMSTDYYLLSRDHEGKYEIGDDEDLPVEARLDI